TLIFVPDDFMQQLISWVAILTIVTGALGAVTQNNLREIFSYLIICHIGFMIAGLGFYSEVAFIGVIFYLIHDIIVKTNLYLVAGLVYKIKGTFNIKRLGGFYKSYPKLSLLLAIPLFSLVGVPPLSGFWAKIFLIEGGFALEQYFSVLTIILGSLITLIIIAKIWTEVFWKE